jgi:hypothetical protein
MNYGMKKIMLVAMGAMMTVGIIAGAANAAFFCEEATVIKAGVTPDTLDGVERRSAYKIKITCPGQWNGATRGFYLTSDAGDAAFATALSAIAAGNTVRVEIVDDQWNSLMTAIELNNQ